MLNTVLSVILWILVIAAIVLGVLYYFGRKLEKKQAASQAMMEAAKQTVSILVIDKKKLKIKESGLPRWSTTRRRNICDGQNFLL